MISQVEVVLEQAEVVMNHKEWLPGAEVKNDNVAKWSDKSLPIHSCDQFDFTSASNKGLKIHVGKMHESECPECNEIFAGEAKLKTHMCRLNVTNPSFQNFYMKNCFLKDSCISVFCEEQKKK